MRSLTDMNIAFSNVSRFIWSARARSSSSSAASVAQISNRRRGKPVLPVARVNAS